MVVSLGPSLCANERGFLSPRLKIKNPKSNGGRIVDSSLKQVGNIELCCRR